MNGLLLNSLKFNSDNFIAKSNAVRHSNPNIRFSGNVSNVNHTNVSIENNENALGKCAVFAGLALAAGVISYIIKKKPCNLSSTMNHSFVDKSLKKLSPAELIADNYTPVSLANLNLLAERYSKHGYVDVFFYKKGSTAIPVLSENSLLSEFSTVSILSDEKALIRFDKVKDEIIDMINERYRTLGVSKTVINSKHVDIFGELYDCLRKANYSAEETIAKGDVYSNVIATKVNGIDSGYVDFPWFYRWPKINGTFTSHSKYRISLNAKIDKELIENLDNYFVNNNMAVKYKVPDSLADACERPDTYTIYFQDELTDKIKQDIAQIAKPYIRKTKNSYPIGNLISDGVTWQKEAGKDDVQDIFKVFYAINPMITKDIILHGSQFKPFKDTMSAGEIETAKIIIKHLISAT